MQGEVDEAEIALNLADKDLKAAGGFYWAFLARRYLVINWIDYDRQHDEIADRHYVMTLRDAADRVEEHVFEEPRTDFTFRSVIVDLDTGKEVEFDVVQKVVVKEPKKARK